MIFKNCFRKGYKFLYLIFLMLLTSLTAFSYEKPLKNYALALNQKEISYYQYIEKDTTVFEITVSLFMRDNMKVWEVISSPQSSEGSTIAYLMNDSDHQVISLDQTKDYTQVHWTFSGNKALLQGKVKGENLHKEIKLPQNVNFDFYDTMRRFDFSKKKGVSFTMVLPHSNPSSPSFQSFDYKYIGDEKITTNLGTFDCYKIKLTLSFPYSLFYTGYFWIEKTPARRLIKGMQRQGTFELVKYEVTNR